MARTPKRTRLILSLLTLALVGAALTAAFWPRPVLVDFGAVDRGALQVTIDEVGRTRVHDAYLVSTPVAGRLLRVTVRPSDPVRKGGTIAHMRPTNPSALDARTREQARAAVDAAEAGLRLARANLNAAVAENDLAQGELSRTEQLATSGIVSSAALDREKSAARTAQARLDTAEAAISMREAELANARALLIGFDDQGLAAALAGNSAEDIPLVSPIDGRVLRVVQQSETVLPAGAPVVEVGDIESDLEVVVDLVSSDAVQVRIGDRVMIEDWGGPVPLAGQVARIDPFGTTRFSALGVEEQRVGVTVAFTGPSEDRTALGHGYRVVARIVVWEAEDVLRVPSSALFRHAGGWAVFTVEEGRARLSPVEIGATNGEVTEVLDGLREGARVILYPSASLVEDALVAARTAT